MFADPLPAYANTRSPRVAAGLGTIARVVASGADIYPGKLRLAEAMHRIRTYYWPYHNALRELITATQEAFGGCILLDCHSMPSVGGPMDQDPGYNRVDFVLGDCHGTSCSARVTRTAERSLRDLGYHVTRNAPYSGGFVTRHYGRPEDGVHALQIEVNRSLYMDEIHVRRGAGLGKLAREMECVVAALGTLDPARL
jgi:N-formylglutamate amidohydrolase